METIIKTIAEQINFRELKWAGFKFVYDDKELSLGVYKGAKHFIIKLNLANDLYDIRKVRTRNYSIVEDKEIGGVFCDQLSDMIEKWFNFQYINKVVFN